MDNLLTSLNDSAFSYLKWTGGNGKYRADFAGGYLEVKEKTRMDDGTNGSIAFYVSNPQKRQIFGFSWRNRDKREMTILRAYCEMHAIHSAMRAAFGDTK